MKTLCTAMLTLTLSITTAKAGTIFIEAENFAMTNGWKVVTGPSARGASGLAMLNGSTGAPGGTATTTVNIKDAGRYHIWVRYTSHPQRRGPFRVTALANDREVGSGLFDAAFEGKSARDTETWKRFEATLPEGDVTLRLDKHEKHNGSSLARNVDCLLLTMDDDLVPNHLHFGAQTFVRVTIGEGYERPLYIHIFADHFHAPWYQHYSLGRSGAIAGIATKKPDLLKSGERTEWCNITPMIYQDSGAMLNMTARYTYRDYAERLRATFEFASAPDEKSIVRTLQLNAKPGGFAVFMPPNLLTKENVALFKYDREIAEETGRLADAYTWPTHGKKPQQFPFFVSAAIDRRSQRFDEAVIARERKTLSYFGFTDEHHRHINGLWFMKNNSYCEPDLEKMKAQAAAKATEFRRDGGRLQDIVFAELMDEPTGTKLEVIAADPAYLPRFRLWLKAIGKTPADLLVADESAIRLVTEAQRDEFPALYYYSQRFRTRALGDFMAVQRKYLEEAFGGPLPTLANFSDGAIYAGNFYNQGVDYFELLDAPDQNAIWGEDWANLSSTYQCASYNVDLMRGAARDRGQTIGHHLVAYAGRKPWDVKLKATSELARGVKILNNFCYGPTWATHEGGPYWRSSVWQAKPQTWTANAALTREVGAVEDLLITAMPTPAKTALLYSSSSDIWTINGNLAYGFDRMHTWLALTHAQMPVDVVSERQVVSGSLASYDVCYLSGPNLTRAAAEQIQQWVQQGGTLWLTAGAATRDEYNRPLSELNDLLPAQRGECMELQKQTAAGKYLRMLMAKDQVSWKDTGVDVLSVKQSLVTRDDATAVLARFKDQSPAIVRGNYGKGRVYCVGFLPALAYIKQALDARHTLEDQAASRSPSLSLDDAGLLERSANPWDFPPAIRELLLTPIRDAGVISPIECQVPLVDAVVMMHEKGVLVPLANYTNKPIGKLPLVITVPRPVARAESAVEGVLRFTQAAPNKVELFLPLENNDFVKLYFE